MNSVDPILREAAIARVQALNAVDQDFSRAVRLVADDMRLSRSSVIRWARAKLGEAAGDGDRVQTRVLGAGPIWTSTLYLLRQYEGASGLSADEYSETPQLHPMAEGKYMSSLVALYRTGVVKEEYVKGKLRQSLDRLERTVVTQLTGVAWGLGFPFREASADEPYVITTCIVVTGLLDALEIADGDDRARLAELVKDALIWLLDGARRESWNGFDVPTFSQSIPEVVFNVVAQWSYVLNRAQDLDILPVSGGRPTDVYRGAAIAVLDQFRPNVGWTYGGLSTRLDLLHTCYIGNALLQTLPDRRDEIERALLVSTTQFLSPHGWYDRFDIVDADDALAKPRPWSSGTHRFLDGAALLGFDRPARPWSMGELLVVAAGLASSGSTSQFWARQLQPVATLTVGRYLETKQFRHSMHLAHGLAAVLEALRRDRKPLDG